MPRTDPGLEYFPLDVDIDSDDKIELIEAKHGIVGFAVIIRLLMKIYRNSYYYEWGEKEQLLLSRRLNVDINTLNAIIEDAINWEIFDRKMFEKHKILTSKGIQKRYTEATKRRQGVELVREYLLLNGNCLNGYNNILIVDIKDDNADITTQSKVKESKVKESKVTYAEFVHMTKSQHEKLIQKFGERAAATMIEILDNYKGSKGKTYKDDYRAILNWVIERYQEERIKGGPAATSKEQPLTTKCPNCREYVSTKDIDVYNGAAGCSLCKGVSKCQTQQTQK